MNAHGYRETIAEELNDREFRHAFASEHVRTGLAYQIAALRDQRGWSQAKLGAAAGKPQSVVSRLEDPDYGRVNLQTLLEIAAAFDVGLIVRFATFGELLDRTQDVSTAALYVPSFADEPSRAAHPLRGSSVHRFEITKNDRITAQAPLPLSEGQPSTMREIGSAASEVRLINNENRSGSRGSWLL